ncbi:MAG: hypothetical protein RR891_09385 [Clostridium sp.]|uniref:hypothetical protein n=1 Tax=Clostridium sp. TaxID=1506 RepID=UPI00302A8D6F
MSIKRRPNNTLIGIIITISIIFMIGWFIGSFVEDKVGDGKISTSSFFMQINTNQVIRL